MVGWSEEGFEVGMIEDCEKRCEYIFVVLLRRDWFKYYFLLQ